MPKKILAMESVNFPPPSPLVGTPKKQNMNKFCYYHGNRGNNTNDCYHLKKQIEEVVTSEKLNHLVKYIRQGNQGNGSQGQGGMKVINMSFDADVKSRLRKDNAPLVRTRMRSLGAMGSTIHSMIKFPMAKGVAMMRTNREAIWKCRQIDRMHSSWKETSGVSIESKCPELGNKQYYRLEAFPTKGSERNR
ncbi:hypothetical protein Tco_0396277 [Tanacetum coccineum]